MTLSQQQKALIENLVMLIEEDTPKREYCHNQYSNKIIYYAFRRVKIMLRRESLESHFDSHVRKKPVIAVAEIIGKEVRKARYYKNMTAEKIIESLDIAFEILKRDDSK